MDISTVIAQILGIFFVVIGASMIIDGRGTADVMKEAIDSKSYLWSWGVAGVATGAIIIPLNNIWTSGMPLVITVMGWLALLKGTFILLFPNITASVYRKFSTPTLFVVAGIVAVALGLSLIYW